jgi:hypothetical protein
MSIVLRYEITLKWYISRGMLTEYDNLRNTGWWKPMIVELIINAIAPYPFLDTITFEEYSAQFDSTITHDVNDLLLFFVFIRVYLVIKFSLFMT